MSDVSNQDATRILAKMSATSYACRACQRGCYEDDTRKLLSWNLGYTPLQLIVQYSTVFFSIIRKETMTD